MVRVDVLEMVDIDQCHCQRSSEAAAALQFITRNPVDGAAIRKTGQGIGQRHFLEYRILLLELRYGNIQLARAIVYALFQLQIEFSELIQ